jgi:transposase
VPYARVCAPLADLFGATLSRGTLVQWVQQAAQAVALVEAAIKQALSRVPVLHSDETGVRREGTLAWAHVASTSRLTHYAIHTKQGSEDTEAIGILPAFTGVSVHDGWVGYRARKDCRHALCNIHHLVSSLPRRAVSAGLGERAQGAVAGNGGGWRAGMRHIPGVR